MGSTESSASRVKRSPAVFVDASALVAAAGRPEGGSGTLLALCRSETVRVAVSRFVLAEADRNVREKMGPEALRRLHDLLRDARPQVVPEPPPKFVQRYARAINAKDAPVLAAAVACAATALITLDRDFNTPAVRRAVKSLRICTPGEYLQFLRGQEVSAVR